MECFRCQEPVFQYKRLRLLCVYVPENQGTGHLYKYIYIYVYRCNRCTSHKGAREFLFTSNWPRLSVRCCGLQPPASSRHSAGPFPAWHRSERVRPRRRPSWRAGSPSASASAFVRGTRMHPVPEVKRFAWIQPFNRSSRACSCNSTSAG